ncbi:MAG: acyltransferase [Lactobacillus sp.]|uniref:acyltransferase family protein n=1 Tax=Bombilactobacillus bombi TaxID=1303590 RepID=UPI0035EED92F|nr:acyltransferase [Lactobacillus sp.]
MKSQRDSKFELLRIIAIFLVVYDHTSQFTNWDFWTMPWYKQGLIQLPVIGGKLGVNLFFLITGYFLICRQNFRIKAVIKIWLTTIFYSWAILALAFLFKWPNLTKKTVLANIFPISFNGYWFITVYLVLMLIYPVLNKMILALSQRQYIWLLTVGFICLFIWSAVFNNEAAGMTAGSTIILGVYLYFVGSYLRLYQHQFRIISNNKLINGIILIVTILLMIGSILLIDWSRQFTNAFYYTQLVDGNSPLELIAAMALFLIVMNSRSFYSSCINRLASTCMAVYIVNASLLTKDVFYSSFINLKSYQQTPGIYLIIMGAAVVITLGLMLLDLLRQLLLTPLEKRVVAYLSRKILKHIE